MNDTSPVPPVPACRGACNGSAVSAAIALLPQHYFARPVATLFSGFLYSLRRTLMGSIREARYAGRNAATNVATSRTPTPVAIDAGSAGLVS